MDYIIKINDNVIFAELKRFEDSNEVLKSYVGKESGTDNGNI